MSIETAYQIYENNGMALEMKVVGKKLVIETKKEPVQSSLEVLYQKDEGKASE